MNIIGVWIGPRRATICSAVVRSGDWMTMSLSRIRKSRIGFVFQNFNLPAEIDRGGNVELPLVYAGVSRRERHDRAMELLGRVVWIARDIGLLSCREARSSALRRIGHWSMTRP